MSYWSVSFAYLIDIDSLAADQRFEVSVNLVGIDLMKDVGDQRSPLTPLPPTHIHPQSPADCYWSQPVNFHAYFARL